MHSLFQVLSFVFFFGGWVVIAIACWMSQSSEALTPKNRWAIAVAIAGAIMVVLGVIIWVKLGS